MFKVSILWVYTLKGLVVMTSLNVNKYVLTFPCSKKDGSDVYEIMHVVSMKCEGPKESLERIRQSKECSMDVAFDFSLN